MSDAGTTSRNARLRAYARLVVRTAIGVEPGQDLLVEAELESAPLARAIAVEAYEAGARHVDVLYSDRWVQRALVASAPEETLGWTPQWMLDRMARAIERGSAVASISSGSGAEVFKGVDEGRLARSRYRELDRIWVEGVLNRRVPWTMVAYPTERWAREMLGEPDIDRLWDAIAHALRLDDGDPAMAWKRRLDDLETRAEALTERGFAALRYRGPDTDLEVGLLNHARWLAGRMRTLSGRSHVANLPTEEVFTSPNPLQAEGTIRSTRPLALNGTLVEGLQLRLSGGAIVEMHATHGEGVVRDELAIDDGARRLGELALVDSSSAVGETGLIFHNTLFDENATSHVAWGSGLPWVLEHLPDEERALTGVNDSSTHVDFMVGAPELEIDGIEQGGNAVPLIRGGHWQLVT
jgi:aminopeptidase